MAIYAIGDVQGCAVELERLLDAIRFDPAADRLWLVGDLVNRGPESLRTLRLVRAIDANVTVVLGNHDLRLLAAFAGVRPINLGDALGDVLEAGDATELCGWLRSKPLAHRQTVAGVDYLMVHAGVPPQWSVEDTMARAAEIEAMLGGDAWREFLTNMYGDWPDRWADELSGWPRLRVIVNALTRLRFCTSDGTMDLVTKEGLAAAPVGYLPWFEIPDRASAAATLVVGHWSTLGLRISSNVLALDTGCVWGGQLSALCLEDRRLIQVPCPCYRNPT